MIKHSILTTLVCLAPLFALPGSAEDGIYFGKASTGERVFYRGAKAQCGDLPRSHDCWLNTPMVAYRIGQDNVSAVADCRRGIFKEVWLGGRIVERNMKPSSKAIGLVLEVACNSLR
jgi:hypothetical protein